MEHPRPFGLRGPAADQPFADVAETHSAAVFFFGDRAYKVKKPVDLGFLDFRDREVRGAICHKEVALNRRLAPDVYLGVTDLVGPGGEICDHAVTMRRLPADRRLTALIERGEAVEDHLVDLARLLATFHAGAERSEAADQAAGVEATRRRWSDNTAALIDFTREVFEDEIVGRVHGLASRYLDGRAPLFAERVARGRACDGHGDLLADDVFVLDDGPRVLDCLEFDDALRLGDQLADVAFLAMDLHWLGHPELAGRFLEAYQRHTADVWPPTLACHHIAYRAQVRAKVAAIRAAQGVPGAIADARRHLELAAAQLDQGRVRLVLVGGLPGTGKSTLAGEVAGHLGATLLSSDVIRKELAGMAGTTPCPAPFGAGLYDPAVTERTYEALLERARVALAHGETVVLDASWTAACRRRQAAATADRSVADLLELRCVCPAEVASDRLRRRAAGTTTSDATPEIAVAMARAQEPWRRATVVDTSADLATSVAAALDAVGWGRMS